MGRPRILNKEERVTERHVQIIRATYELLAQKGLHSLSLQDVADRLDVSKGVILYYFKSKQRLLLATWRWVLSRVAERIRRAIARSPTPEAQVEAMVEAIFVDAEANRTFYLTFLDLVGSVARNPAFSALAEEARRIEEETYAEVIRFGVERGVFLSQDPAQDAKILRALIDGLFIQWVQEKDWRGLHPLYKDLCQKALLKYLRCPGGGQPDGNAR
ncbi:TetR family transcriptional regulator C-terminal domain-containing protein [Thermus sp.]|uniref:TetR/AcrR family transcriptional regulator n=1 Tax=Thermus sp. TaxID=275 RepID=UPI0025E4F0B7|nr:TetR family transcriptional regulator C-terminal domain-containing protein [Thermus sp.]MCS6867885.1 TetR family transcriptional regulator C-terminal domain-containing protein [Thermus sp.]MDW8358459.1 TetR family transcriptional regulator C-terminal domain-containing protein [Thermus sp.]